MSRFAYSLAGLRSAMLRQKPLYRQFLIGRGRSVQHQRSFGGFKQLHNSETRVTICDGRLAGLNAVNEMLADCFQSLSLIYLRDSDIAHPVLHERFVTIFIPAHFNALVEDLDLILVIKMVVDDHLAASSDKCPPEFCWR